MARRSFTKKDRARIFNAQEIEAFKRTMAYDPATGRLVWLVPPRYSSAKVGDEVGAQSQGYRRVKIDGASILCHRLIWAIHYGEDARSFIDHRNGDRQDNRIENLRLASRAENAMNKALYAKASCLPKGVTFHAETGKFRARIRIDGKLKSLGLYVSADEAGAAYSKAALEFFGEFARGHTNAS